MLRTLGSPRTGTIDTRSRAPFGWAPLVVLFIVGFVDRIEYNLLIGVLPAVQREWGFSDTAAGSIATAAALAAAVVTLPAGYLADRFSRTRIIAVVVLVWAVATLGSGLATGCLTFYLMRVLLAAAENIDNPASGSLLADYYPRVSRAKAYGLTRLTMHLGGVGTLLGGVLAEVFSWRTAFLLMVVPGVLTAVLVWLLREPRRGELDHLVAAGDAFPLSAAFLAKPPFWRQFRQVLAIPTLTFVCAGLSLLTFGLSGIFYWLPTFMVRAFGVGTGTAGSLSGLVTIAGTLTGTLVGSWLGRKWHDTRKGGRLLAGGGITAGSLVPAASRGLGFAVLQLLITAGGAFGSLVVGIASDQLGSLLAGMYILVLPMVAGGLLALKARGSFERDAREVMEAAGRCSARTVAHQLGLS
ncbi:MFS transporter [Nonomuraea sp. NPDC000554]|uniref:MFS transporter n=1 Tax=Nonomuraea sp. NPDC000554 TaxID=3154259 RepID=UPI003328C4C6